MPTRGDMAPMRFVSPDLAGLPPPPAVEGLDFEAIVAGRLAELEVKLGEAGLDDIIPVLALEGEPLVIDQQVNAAFELAYRQRVNDAVRANLWATAVGPQMDHLAATFYDVTRLVIVEADPDAVPPVAQVDESDDDFRERAPLSMEARSGAGPEGAYIYLAKAADGDVLDVAVYGAEDGAFYGEDEDTPVMPAEILIVALSRTGDGTASTELQAAIRAALSPEDARPIADKVTIESARVIHFSVEAVIRHAPGADPAPLAETATARAWAYVRARHRVGRLQQRLGIGAALKVTDVEEIGVVLRDAEGEIIDVGDINPGPKGAAFCTGITVEAQVMTGGWSV